MINEMSYLILLNYNKMRGITHLLLAIQNWFHLKCKLFNKHNYVIEKKYNENILKLRCAKCQKTFGVDLESALIFTWDRNMMLVLTIYENNLRDEVHSREEAMTNNRLKIVV